MIKVLIPTDPNDMHAIFVKLALEKKGHMAELWFSSAYPTEQTHSFSIENKKMRWSPSCLSQKTAINYDIVWLRRPGKPKLPNIFHPDDAEHAKKENLLFFQSMWQVILPQATWINPVNSVNRANSKLLQLKLASQIGMQIPRTLMSNNPDDIKEFVKVNKNKVIFKTFYPLSWLEHEEKRTIYTRPIDIEILPSDKMLKATPGIFQEKLIKQYEVRATYFGNNYIAVKIYSKSDPKNTDWRSIPHHELHLEKIILPQGIDNMCKSLMKELNIVFGCFDFIVTKDSNYYFLEVNEQGQFLWIETANPEIKILQAFVDFLTLHDVHKVDSSTNISLFDFEKEAFALRNNHLSTLS